jgi:hypothetical protein
VLKEQRLNNFMFYKGRKYYEKTLMTSLMLLSSGLYANDCMVELQFEGAVLGQNTFIAQTCIDATRECKRAQKRYEMRFGFTSADLSCVRLGDVSPNPGNGGYNPNPNPNPGNGGYNPNPGNGNYDPTYSRTQALLDLEAIENSTSQADEVYSMIISYVNDFKITLKDGVDLFREITRIHGGNGSTTATKQAFEILVEEAALTQADVFLLAQKYDSIMSTERSVDQSVENILFIFNQTQVNNIESVRAMDSFNIILNIVGSGNTTDARNVFSRLVRVRRVMLETLVEDFQELFLIERSVNDALSDLNLVLSAAELPSVRYREAKQSMIDLLNTYGSGSTSTVQSKFRRIYGI